MKVAIIGAGLAGCAAGYFLKRSGADVILYDEADEVASGASGNDVGMYNPRFTAFETPESLFYTACFDQALALFKDLDDIDWHACGALHLISDEKKEKRYYQTVENWAWSEERLRIVDRDEASEIADVNVPYGCLYLPESGSVSPKKLCRVMTEDLDIRYGQKIKDLDDIDADAIIVANGMGAKELLDLPLRAVRGQITEVSANGISMNLKVNLHYGGYVSACQDGSHTIGATFQRWLEHTDILGGDDVYNIERLSEFLPELAEGLEVTGHRASIRTTSPDHFPVIGHVRDNIYVSTAHGSHGILTSIGAAGLLCSMIMEAPVNHLDETTKALCPLRFKDAKTQS